MDPESETDTARGCHSGAAQKRSTVPLVGKGKEGEERESCCTQKSRHPRDRRPEPTVKAQHVFGTNKLADLAAR